MAPFLFLDGIYRNNSITLVEGTILRDFTFVGDLVRAIAMAAGISTLPQGSPGPPPGLTRFNIGSGTQRSMADLANEIAAALGRPPGSFHTNPMSLGSEEVPATHANIARARQLLGWEPLVPWQDGIRRMVEWYVRRAEPNPGSP
jgi:nucleoside-diphosphate-sugar epimerase